jgi:hypothetical protein
MAAYFDVRRYFIEAGLDLSRWSIMSEILRRRFSYGEGWNPECEQGIFTNDSGEEYAFTTIAMSDSGLWVYVQRDDGGTFNILNNLKHTTYPTPFSPSKLLTDVEISELMLTDGEDLFQMDMTPKTSDRKAPPSDVDEARELHSKTCHHA